MSVQAALRFIEKVGNDEALKDRIRALGSDADLEAIARIGAEAGHDFTADELQAAFKRDWATRWAFYGTRGLGPGSTPMA
jgi:predicted ribosomally synthesized peptide with nif11-like leader